MPISIQKASLKDIKQLTIVFDLYRQFYKQKTDVHLAEKFLKERIQKQDSMLFLAKAEDDLVGFTQLYPLWSSVGMKKLWMLNDLYIIQSYRKKGIAKLLLEKAKQIAKNTNSKGLFLQTSKDNKRARYTYSKNGWTLDDTFLTYEYYF